MRALLAFVLTASVLAGCTSPLGGGGDMTAKEAEGRAAQRAREWRGDAVLVGVATVEAGPGAASFLGSGNASGWPVSPAPDGNVGDGRAPQWFFQYHSAAANRTYGVAVFRNGTLLADEDRGGGDREGPIANWNIDSPRAAEIALQDANFSAAARASDGGIVYALGAGDQPDPIWALTTGSERAATGGFALINARTGERLPFPSFGFGSGFPFGGDAFRRCDPDVQEAEGSLDAQDDTAEYPFTVDPGCDQVELELEWEGTLPTDRVAVRLERDGAELEPEASDEGDGSYAATYDVAPGEHRAVVRLAGSAPVGVQASYRLTITVS